MTALLRTLRQQRAVTLAELATATGLTSSYLSKVERGQSTPSVAAALRIARVLDVDVAQLFSDDPRARSLTVERAAQRTERRHAIASGTLGKAMSPFALRPGRQFNAHNHPGHAGQEFMFVHRGSVDLDYDGDVVELHSGDCAYFDAAAPHRVRQSGGEAAEVIVVTYESPHREGESPRNLAGT